MPKNYFPNDDPTQIPLNTWRAHTFIVFKLVKLLCLPETPYKWDYVDDIEYHI